MVQLHDLSPSHSAEDGFLRHRARMVARHALRLRRNLEQTTCGTSLWPDLPAGDLTAKNVFVAFDECAFAFKLSDVIPLDYAGAGLGHPMFEHSGTLPEFFDQESVRDVWRLCESVTSRLPMPEPCVTTSTRVVGSPHVAGKAPQLRTAELEWLQSHGEDIRQYAGKWIAVEGTDIVAVADSEMEADRLAREAGVSIPFVVRIPRGDEPPIVATCQRASFL